MLTAFDSGDKKSSLSWPDAQRLKFGLKSIAGKTYAEREMALSTWEALLSAISKIRGLDAL
jgi:hypothetical protein